MSKSGNIRLKTKKTSVRKAGAPAIIEFGYFVTLLIREISESSWSLKFGRTGVDLKNTSLETAIPLIYATDNQASFACSPVKTSKKLNLMSERRIFVVSLPYETFKLW